MTTIVTVKTSFDKSARVVLSDPTGDTVYSVDPSASLSFALHDGLVLTHVGEATPEPETVID